MHFFQKEVWLLLIIHTMCCSFHLQTYLSNIANNRCGQIYAMSPDNTCRARRPNDFAKTTQRYDSNSNCLQNLQHGQWSLVIITTVTIITIRASLLVGPWAARDICTGVKVWPAFPTSMTPGLPFQFQLKSKRIYPITNV